MDADPDLNGSSRASKLKIKPGLKDKSSAPNLNAKLGKRKAERDNDDGRAAKKLKGVSSARKSKPQVKTASVKKPVAKAVGKPIKSNGKKADPEEEDVTNDDSSVGWEDVEGADMQAATRCVCPSEDVDASPNLRVTYRRSLFHDSDATDEDAEEFTGFTGGLEDLESDEDESEEYVPLFSFPSHYL